MRRIGGLGLILGLTAPTQAIGGGASGQSMSALLLLIGWPFLLLDLFVAWIAMKVAQSVLSGLLRRRVTKSDQMLSVLVASFTGPYCKTHLSSDKSTRGFHLYLSHQRTIKGVVVKCRQGGHSSGVDNSGMAVLGYRPGANFREAV